MTQQQTTDPSLAGRFFIISFPDGHIGPSMHSMTGEPQAEVYFENEEWLVRDLGGRHPVLVDGKEIAGRVSLGVDATLVVGEWEWSPRRESPRASKGIAIHLNNVGMRVRQGVWSRSLEILKPTTLSINPGEFIGILGPSGSGKSTLLKLMIGDTVPTSGSVSIGGMGMAAFMEKHGRRLAYLPQELILHPALSPRKALAYQAKLQGVYHRGHVVDCLERVGMGHRLDIPIRRLSGGEKKRVALAALLLADPLALFLDEATSGLDPALEKEMMDLFRSLADEGRTVVCITHFPQSVECCDRLLVVAAAKIRFIGSPLELKSAMRVSTIEDIYPLIAGLACDDESIYYAPKEPVEQSASYASPLSGHESPATPAIQCGILLGRYLRLLAADPGALALLILQAPIIGLMIGGTFGSILVDYPEQHAADWKQVAFLLVMSVIWCATTNGVREIVKERAVFLHEKRYGVNNIAYLISKFAPLSIIATAQSALLLYVITTICGFAGSAPSHGFVLALLAISGTAIGLTISASVRSSEKAMTALPIILIAQGVLSGALARLEGLPLLAAEILVPAYWGVSGLKASLPSVLLEATFVSIPGEYQHAILGRGPSVFLVMLALAVQSLLLLVAALFVLSKRRS